MSETTPVLLYDGECGFCRQCIRWLERRLADETTLRLALSSSVSDEDLAALGLSRAHVQESVCWSGDHVESGAMAISRCLLACRGAWRVVGRSLRLFPISWVAGIVYRFVARNRRRLPGASVACATNDVVS